MVATFEVALHLETPPSKRRSDWARNARALASALREEFGVPFTLYDGLDGQPVVGSESATSDLHPCDRINILRLATAAKPSVIALDDLRFQLAIPYQESSQSVLLAVATLDALAIGQSERLQEKTRLEKWAGSVAKRLRPASFLPANTEAERPSAAGALNSSASAAWNTLLSLDKLFRRLRIHKEPTKYRQRILDSASELLNVQTLAWVSRNGGEPIVGGEPYLSAWDCQQLAVQLARNPGWDESGVLVINDITNLSWSGRCPHIVNLCALALHDQRLNGWALAINKRPPNAKPANEATTAAGDESVKFAITPKIVVPFQRSDAAMLTPFLSLLGLYQSTSQRYHTLQELMVGLARALTASIDAKDQYTYGHSERVARIAVELGGEMGLDEDELNDIYLTGLLHDIGKIGVPDAVLGKPDKLTPDETKQVQQHVTIGYKILSGLKAIGHLLPGVLHHHERIDGGGYPDGLKGDAIPMLARIIAVADGYDAMSSSRPYRQGMPLEKVEQILTDGAGSQWDKDVVFAFLRCRKRIHSIRQQGIGESLRFALDGMMRDNDRFDLDSIAATITEK